MVLILGCPEQLTRAGFADMPEKTDCILIQQGMCSVQDDDVVSVSAGHRQ